VDKVIPRPSAVYVSPSKQKKETVLLLLTSQESNNPDKSCFVCYKVRKEKENIEDLLWAGGGVDVTKW
jgi:hypothetical protein